MQIMRNVMLTLYVLVGFMILYRYLSEVIRYHVYIKAYRNMSSEELLGRENVSVNAGVDITTAYRIGAENNSTEEESKARVTSAEGFGHSGMMDKGNDPVDPYVAKILRGIGYLDRNGNECRPRKSVLFLNLRGSACDALQNGFLRYAAPHNLSVASLPTPGKFTNVVFLGSEDDLYELEKDLSYIYAYYYRLNIRKLRELVIEDAVWVTALRHPRSLYASSYRGYLMTLGLGFEEDTSRDSDKISTMIQEVEETFDLVMVAEHMTESLVLLKKLLCWSDSDMALAFGGILKEEEEEDEDEVFDEKTLQTPDNLNYLDLMLYKHFSSKLEDVVLHLDPDSVAGRRV